MTAIFPSVFLELMAGITYYFSFKSRFLGFPTEQVKIVKKFEDKI